MLKTHKPQAHYLLDLEFARPYRVILPCFERCQCLVCEGVAWRTRGLRQLT